MSKNPNDPEDWEDYYARVIAPKIPHSSSFLRQQAIAERYRPEWERQEEEKRRNRVSRKDVAAEEHAKRVERLNIEIERQKERIRRDEQRTREKEQNEEKKKAEKEAEQERKDPKPIINPAVDLNIPADVRARHIFVPGGSGYGKSAQLSHLIASDIENGHSVIVLDPKGDLIRRICANLSEEQIQRTIYIDMQNPIPIDVLGKDGDPDFLVGDIKDLILKGNQTLDRASPLLSRLVHSLLRVPHASFLDIQYFFTRPERQKEILKTLKETQPFYYNICMNEVVRAPYGEYSPITNRMTDFGLYESLHTILGHPQPLFNLIKEINNKRIILVNLGGKGEPRKIFGTLFISQIQQAALSRAGNDERFFIPETERQPIRFYVDEFETFQTATFHEIISIARGLGLHITVATPTISQISSQIRDAIFDIFSTHIIFHLELNIDLYENRMRPYQVKRLAELKQFQAVFKIGDDPPVFRWTKTPPQFGREDDTRAAGVIKRLIKHTQDEYGWEASDRKMAETSAQSSQKRIGDNSPLQYPPDSHTKGNGIDYNSIEGEKT